MDKLLKGCQVASPALILWVMLQIANLKTEILERLHETENRVSVLETQVATLTHSLSK